MPAPYQTHSATSAEAAERAKPKAKRDRERLLRQLRVFRTTGLTDEEMQADLRMDGSTQRPRRVELVNAGLVEDSGEKRRTRSGRWAVVWRAVPAKEAT